MTTACNFRERCKQARTKATDKGTDNRIKGTDTRTKGTDNRTKSCALHACALRACIANRTVHRPGPVANVAGASPVPGQMLTSAPCERPCHDQLELLQGFILHAHRLFRRICRLGGKVAEGAASFSRVGSKTAWTVRH